MRVLLFQKRFHAGLVDGAVRLTFRLWPAARVKAGGRYRVHPIGRTVLAGEVAWPLDPGASARRDLYNLYHVLNHLNLFGGGYRAQAEATIERLLAGAG